MESMGSRRVRHDEQLSLCVTLGPFGDITQYSWLSPMYTEGIHADKVCFFFFFFFFGLLFTIFYYSGFPGKNLIGQRKISLNKVCLFRAFSALNSVWC